MAGWPKEKVEINGEVVEAQTPIIVSASRSTDIPAFYAEWFIERLRKGYVKWYNPFNNTPLYVSFKDMRLIVFWSKNPAKMIPYLDELDTFCPNYYFQFTLNDYVAEGIEPRVPSVDQRIDTFQKLSERLGRERMVWRFDPLMLTDKMGVDELLAKVQRIGDRIGSKAGKFVFSFIDIASYKKVAGNLQNGGIAAREFKREEMLQIAKGIGELAKGWGVEAGTCAEAIPLEEYGIEHNRCVDDRLMVKCFSHDEKLMKFIGAKLIPGNPLFGEPDKWVLDAYKKDGGQRAACGCIMSKDIGEYNTCPHLCHYCYANTSNVTAMANWKRHCENPRAETITGR